MRLERGWPRVVGVADAGTDVAHASGRAESYPDDVTGPRWLSADEQRSWRSFVTMSLLLHDRLDRLLQRDHGLSTADYEILVRLSEAPGRRLRMSELAAVTLSSRSRLSHQVSRMESEGLVVRVPCPHDGRGTHALLTDQGWQRLVDAAPEHVEHVRTHLVDRLTPQEMRELGRLCAVVADHLESFVVR